MYKILVKADIYKIAIETNCSKIEKYIDDYLEDFRRLTICFEKCSVGSDVPDAFFEYMDSDEYALDVLPDGVILLKCPWSSIDSSTIIPMVFRLIVEIIRQNNGEIKMHASAVAKGDSAVLFIAPSEGGKTSTAMRMCQKYGCKLIANDATVVAYNNGIPHVLRGDSLFKVRANGLEAYSRGDNNGIEVSVKTETPWYEKSIIEADELGVVTSDKQYKLKSIFFVKLDTLIDKMSALKYDKNVDNDRWFKQKMMVLQNISGTIRGVDLIPTGNEGTVLPLYIPCVDTIEKSMFRRRFLNELFQDCEIYQTRGQLDDITEYINEVAFGD